MENITTSISTLLDSMNPVVQKLAETFCVSVDLLKENAMTYILMYGRYEWINTLIFDVCVLGLLVGLIVGAGVFMGWLWYYDEIVCLDDVAVSVKKSLRNTLIGYILWVLLVALCSSASYLISPEIYSIKAVMELIPQ